MKHLLFVIFIFQSPFVFGSEQLSGQWCESSPRYSIYTRLNINEEGDYALFGVSSRDGEIVLEGRGFLSQGASAAQMVDNEKGDLHLTEYRVGEGSLRLFFEDGSVEAYQSCD